MATKRTGGFLSVVVLLVTLTAAADPAAHTLGKVFGFLWPGGVVVFLVLACTALGLLLWAKWTLPPKSHVEAPPVADGVLSSPRDSVNPMQARETAHDAVLAASDAYINAHQEVKVASTLDDVDALRQAQAMATVADRNFVFARQRVEQHGAQLVLEATLDVEAAVKRGEVELAHRLRSDYLVPAIRHEKEQAALVPRG